MSAGGYSLYIVRCSDGSLYTGIALDVERRIEQHESGVGGARYLRGRGPLTLEFSARLGDRGAALRAERRVKRLSRQGKEQLITGQRSLAELVAS